MWIKMDETKVESTVRFIKYLVEETHWLTSKIKLPSHKTTATPLYVWYQVIREKKKQTKIRTKKENR